MLGNCREDFVGVLPSLDTTLESPVLNIGINDSFHGRLSFWYYFVNIRAENRLFEAQISTDNTSKVIWRTDQGQSSHWNFVQMEFESDMSFRVVFKVERNNCGAPVALDEVTVENGESRVTFSVLGQISKKVCRHLDPKSEI